MRKFFALIATMFMSLGLVVATAGMASAAPPAQAGPPASSVKHTSVTTAPLLKLGATLGIFTISTSGGTTWDAETGTITARVVGNPEASDMVIQKGAVILTKADGSSLRISNIKYDVDAGIVTAVINDDERVKLYTAEKTSETTAELYVHPEGGAILREFINTFGLPFDGSHFGTSTLK